MFQLDYRRLKLCQVCLIGHFDQRFDEECGTYSKVALNV